MQIQRLFEIVHILLNQKNITAKALADQFEVSTRTIYRDVETLSAAGIPIYMSRGKYGGISLMSHFVLNKTVVTDDEKKEILSSLQALNALHPESSANTLNKFSHLFGGQTADWIEVDFSSWTGNAHEAEVFNTAKTAILHKFVLAFTYSGAHESPTHRHVEPLKLCFKGSAWYLDGYCQHRQDFRFFKLTRIKGLELTQASFTRDAEKQVLLPSEPAPTEWIQLQLRLDAQVAFRVYDEFSEYKLQEDGSFLIHLDCPKSKWLLHYLLTFGDCCEILAPEDLRQDMQALLKKSLKRYE